jgi:hypothetical protein
MTAGKTATCGQPYLVSGIRICKYDNLYVVDNQPRLKGGIKYLAPRLFAFGEFHVGFNRLNEERPMLWVSAFIEEGNDMSAPLFQSALRLIGAVLYL